MSLTKALQNKDMKLLKDVVSQAKNIYRAGSPAQAVMVDTINGYLPITAIFDKKSKWQLVQAEYANIVQKVSTIPDNLDSNIEIAKLIATSDVLYFLTQETQSNGLI